MMVVANDELVMPADPDKAKIPRLELRRPAPKWRPDHHTCPASFTRYTADDLHRIEHRGMLSRVRHEKTANA